MDKLLVFGTGSVAERFMSIVNLNKVKILAFINSATPFLTFHGYDVIGVEKMQEYSYDYIVIASGYTVPIRKVLKDAGIEEAKVVSYIYDDDIIFHELSECMFHELNGKYNRHLMDKWIREDYTFPRFAPAILWDESRCLKETYKDFVREQTVKLLPDVMKERNVCGSIAELGVFRGDFTVVLNKIFNSTKMFLFDTFEGFDEKDVKADSAIENKEGESEKFKDTSVEYVLSRLSDSSRVVVKKGYFPETYDSETAAEEFKFVSIDLNLEKPTWDALELFWPKLVPGGYILVSCYYAPFYEGTRKAVNSWCLKNGVTPIPMADFYGSVLLAKQV